jgi:Lrp/AsnC family transcriptional regulator for asnA, asnC and gidA
MTDIRLDEVDIKILRILQKDGRISYADLARKVGAPQSTVRFKVKKLIEAGVIRRIMAILDPAKVGYKVTLIMLLKVDPKMSSEIFKSISSMKEAHHILEITGKYDIAAILHARDMDHANNLINKIKRIEGVLDAETLIATGLIEIRAELAI